MTGSTRTPMRRGRLVAVVVASALVVAATSAALGSGDDDRLSVHAIFKDASPLLEGNDVRMNGVRVGTIEAMKQVPEGADVHLLLDRAALPVHVDATATIRPDSLLGERFIEIDPGSPDAAAMEDGGTIAEQSTRATTDLDTVLNALDEPTSQALAALVGTLGAGMDGNGERVREAIKALAPALTDTDALVEILSAQDETLGRLVTTLEEVASGIAVDEGKALDRLVSSTDRVLNSTAVRERALRSVLEQLPDTITAARRTLGGLERASLAAEPTLRSLRPTSKDLSAISKELYTFADAADPALKSANPVLALASRLLDEARPVAATLRRAGIALEADAQNLDPLTRDLTRDIVPVFEFLRGWALTTNGRDGLSHYYRANVVLTKGMVTGQIPSTKEPIVKLPGSGTDLLQGLNLDGLLSGLTGGGDGLLGQLLGGQDSLLGGLLSPRTSADGGVTGLSRAQEMDAMNFMLGGN